MVYVNGGGGEGEKFKPKKCMSGVIDKHVFGTHQIALLGRNAVEVANLFAMVTLRQHIIASFWVLVDEYQSHWFLS